MNPNIKEAIERYLVFELNKAQLEDLVIAKIDDCTYQATYKHWDYNSDEPGDTRTIETIEVSLWDIVLNIMLDEQ